MPDACWSDDEQYDVTTRHDDVATWYDDVTSGQWHDGVTSNHDDDTTGNDNVRESQWAADDSSACANPGNSSWNAQVCTLSDWCQIWQQFQQFQERVDV